MWLGIWRRFEHVWYARSVSINPFGIYSTVPITLFDK